MAKKFIVSDHRFSEILDDPKFQRVPRHERKVKIDKRFQSMFTDDIFKVKYTVDKRGKQISKTTTEDFRKFYDLPSDKEVRVNQDEFDKNNGMHRHKPKAIEADKINTYKVKKEINRCNDLPTLTKEEEDIRKKQISTKIRKKLKDMNIDYARGESKLFSESSSDESENEESDEEIYHEWNELDKNAEITNNITKRLAVCHMDWDRIRAIDLMVLFNSFLPAKGVIHSVIIYPSEFGLKRLIEEEKKGPAELVQNNHVDPCVSDRDSEDEEGRHYHVERMREYQLKRLKYYYAVTTFDSPETANIIYTNCNAIEYESSGIQMDLRFIDDDITFHQEPKDFCDNIDAIQNYEPVFFVNTALQQAKVELTWDETDPKRLKFAQRISETAKIQDINDSDLEDLVALSSSEGEDEEIGTEFSSAVRNVDDNASADEDPISVYRNLLKSIEGDEEAFDDKESDGELEITWGADSHRTSTKCNGNIWKNENVDLTPFEQRLPRKRENSKNKKEIRQPRMEDVEVDSKSSLQNQKSENKSQLNKISEKQQNELKLLLLDENTDKKTHFNLKKLDKDKKKSRKRKFKKNKEDKKNSEEVDVNDDRFSALYSSHLYNIDPTDPRFHKMNGMKVFILEKQKRLSQIKKYEKVAKNELDTKTKMTNDSELAFLVESVKNKTNPY